MRGCLTDFIEPAKGSFGPGESGGVLTAVRQGEDGGEESTGGRDGELDGERESLFFMVL